MMEIKPHIFKGKEFKIAKGTTHPEYSFFTFEGEEKDFRDKYWDIKAGDVVFDIGASYGAYSLSACAMGAIVFSFEPEKTVYKDLVQNIEINNWNGVCYAKNIGLWDGKESINMKSYAPHWPEATITSDYAMDTIDNIVAENHLQRLDWVKIDVEGAEVKTIKGGLKTINKFLPKLIIECHIFLDETIVDDIKGLLGEKYKIEDIDRPPCTILYCEPLNG